MTRYQPENDVHPGESDATSGHGGPDSGGQSGDTQGLSQSADANEETVEELADAGQDFEAGILEGVERAANHPGKPVPSHDGQERRDFAGPGQKPV
jgi:hypothetical protein